LTEKYHKKEGLLINIGLGFGKALDIFNSGIVSYTPI